MMRKKKVIMLDIEDTLSDTSHRECLWPKCEPPTTPKSSDYDQWNQALIDDPPTNIIPVIKELAKKYEIVISTSKPHEYRGITTDWVYKNLGWIPKIFLMRGEDCKDLSSPELKKVHKEDIWDEGYEIAFVIDDREDICNMYGKERIHTWRYDKNQDWTQTIPIFIPLPEYLRFPKEPTIRENAGNILANAAKIYKSRNEEYGDAYKKFGNLVIALFPDGVVLKTKEDFDRWGVLTILLSKIQRYCANFNKGGHPDSLDDSMSYSAMLQELDSLVKSDS
jgi:hypothetical protein